jgi:hypothetical protein
MSNLDRIAAAHILQLQSLRREARELESQLRSKRGNREDIKRDLFAVRPILSEVLS